MRLSDATTMTVDESLWFNSDVPILEDGEAPRWRFRYDRFNVDPSPDILLLGAYQHPNTGNNLVGGINLHYLQPRQIDNLAKALPQIMQGGELYERYWTGRQLLPDVFRTNYRTYNARYIRGVEQDVMYPKYGFVRKAKDWLKKKLGGIFKTKRQREIDAQPKYPEDLKAMRDRLDQAVQQLQQQHPEPIEPTDTPEMKRAREAFLQYRREKAARERDVAPDVDDIELQQDYTDFAQARPEPAVQTQQKTPEQARAELEQERQVNQRELLDPDNTIEDLEESIIYYSPVRHKYVIERA